MATEPITHFSDRADAVSAALRMTGARPTASEAMARVDEKITAALSMFDARTSARDLAEFTEAGRTWAKNPTKGGLDRLIEALAAPIGNDATTVPVRVKNEWGEQWQNSTASTPEARRIAAARKGALAGLIAKYDKPEYTTATLIESCKAEVRAWFDNVATEATESLEALDDVARDKATSTGRVAEVIDLIDPATTPEGTILAYRRAARAWAHLDNVAEEYAQLARAMAFNDVSNTPNADRDVFERMEELTSHRARFHALMFDADACALAVFDMNPVKAVATGLGRVAPLADPLGDDLSEFERRLKVITAAVGWLDNRRRTVGDRYRGAKGRYTEHDRFGELTPAASLATFKAERADMTDADTADYDLDPIADIYAE